MLSGLRATWLSCRCPCSWQRSWTRWPLRSLPIQTILWINWWIKSSANYFGGKESAASVFDYLQGLFPTPLLQTTCFCCVQTEREHEASDYVDCTACLVALSHFHAKLSSSQFEIDRIKLTPRQRPGDNLKRWGKPHHGFLQLSLQEHTCLKVSMVIAFFFWGQVIAALSHNIFRLSHQASLLFQQQHKQLPV